MRKNYLISLLALSAMAVSASSMAKENVTVSGSTTVLPVMQKISEHLMQKREFPAVSYSRRQEAR